MPLPSDLAKRRVIGHWIRFDGKPDAGTITLTPSLGHLYGADLDVVVTRVPITITLDKDGVITGKDSMSGWSVPTTDDPEYAPPGWDVVTQGSYFTYELHIKLKSGYEETRDITVPAAAEDLDLLSVPTVAPVSETTTLVTTSQINQPGGVAGLDENRLLDPTVIPDGAGGGAVDSVNGETGEVSLNAADVGAVAKGELVINIKDQGAVGDGVTDDTAALQSALDQASGAGSVLAPTGQYLIGGTLACNDTTLRGEGAGRTVLVLPSVALENHFFDVTASLISDLTIDASQSSSAGNFSELQCRTGTSISRVTVLEARSQGIHRANASNLLISDCRVIDSRGPGIVVQNVSTAPPATDIVVRDNLVDRTGLANPDAGTGIAVHAGDADGIVAPRIVNNDVAMPSTNVGIETMKVTRAVVSGNTVNGGQIGISTAKSPFSAITGNTVRDSVKYCIECGSDYVTTTGNVADCNGISWHGVAWTYTGDETLRPRGGVCSGNTIVGATTSGIQCHGLSIAISGNSIESIDATFAGITLKHPDDATISSNTLYAPVGDGVTHAIELNGCLRVSLTGNNVIGYSNSAIRVIDDISTADRTVTILASANHFSGAAGTTISDPDALITAESRYVGNIGLADK